MNRALPKLVLVAGLVGALSGPAWAGGWYYRWSCTGRCSPGQLAINGIEGPFGSREECDAVRDVDSRAQYFVSEGNLGGLQSCEYIGDGGQMGPPAAADSGQAPNYRVASLRWAIDAGPGWRVRQGGEEYRSAWAVGLDAEFHAGRDAFGGLALFGFHASQVSAPALGEGDHTYAAVPILLGVRITPRLAGGPKWSLRLDLSASYGGYMQVGCSGCTDGALDEFLGFGYLLQAGLDYFYSETAGVGLQFLATGLEMTDGSSGLLVTSPPWMLRLAFVHRPRS